MRIEIRCGLPYLSAVLVLLYVQACQQPAAKTIPAIRHLAEVHKNGSTLYVDRADSRQVMKADSSEVFIAYKIGFEDSVQGDKKYEQERNVYYDFRMAGDWKAVVDSDSIAPVFFQPVTGLNKTNKEGILVFELPAGKRPDALVYNDSFGGWQQQIIALNPHLK
ncbi:hypothetical protein FAM09_09155 [Niastella caeni]|uniref:Uncharacterized protein n=1 Tax=Niastella caeni TaxID=2569763 RepID=A0A4S8HWH6_9BACT|nr:hypothetical protein [Niastella caeni]THU40043.1 hypothetical protein FAM09_09155 [Niastella caeni]